MSLVVGHNSPGCGLDTPSVACEACGEGVVWDRENGSHCGGCGLSAASLSCPECGLRAELDQRQPEIVARPPLATPPREASIEAPRPRARLAALGAAMASTPIRTHAVVSIAAISCALLALLIGGLGDGRERPRDMAVASAPAAAPVPDRIGRGAVELPLDAKPVPLALPAPRTEPLPPLPSTEFEPSPPPVVITRVDPGYRPPAPPQRDVWWQRALRSGRASAPSVAHIPADVASIGQ